MKKTAGLIALIFFSCLWADAQKPTSGKEPAWVTVNKSDYTNTSLDREAEDGYIDVDFEKQVSLAEQSVYIRQSFRIISEAGVQNRSQVSVNFDPSYQRLIFHTIRLIRNGQVVNRLNLAKIKTIQQETELEDFIYDGTLRAVLFVDDVRKGDVLEYSYTIKGFNPIYKNKFSDELATAFPSPLYNLYYKIDVPAGRGLTIKNDNETIQPEVRTSATGTTYQWKKSQVASMHPQDHLPSWYNPYPEIMVSEFNSWKEVNDWAIALFPKNVVLQPELKEKIKDIQAANTNDEKRILSSLRFVQDDIRYMGMEMGVHSHKPGDPNKIFRQRFGDCKEKSYLLCTMLQAMGIEADPVLISTSDKKALNNSLPSPQDFDHVTVRVKLNDSYHWFDPTIAYQRGRINDISYPDYQCGLVITDTTTALTAIKPQAAGEQNVHELFNVKDMSGNATLVVTTAYTGSFADDERSAFNNSSNYDMLQQMKKFYAYYFEKIKADSLTYTDNDSTGVFVTKEYYTIKDFWTNASNAKTVLLSPFVVGSLIKKPDDQIRTMPYYISYPEKYHEEVVINLPEKWDIDTSSFRVYNPAFVLSTKFSTGYKQITIKYDYEALKDNVTPGETDDFIAAVKTVNDKDALKLTYGSSISKNNLETTASGNKIYIVIAFLVLGGGIVWWTQKRA